MPQCINDGDDDVPPVLRGSRSRIIHDGGGPLSARGAGTLRYNGSVDGPPPLRGTGPPQSIDGSDMPARGARFQNAEKSAARLMMMARRKGGTTLSTVLLVVPARRHAV